MVFGGNGNRMALVLTGAAMGACHPSAPEVGRGGCPESEMQEYDERYPNAVVEDRRQTVIPGVELWTVWEGSHANEDPISTEEWLVLRGGLRFRRDRDGVRAALCHTGWGPSSRREAVRVATLAVVGNDASVIEQGQQLPATIPDRIRSRIEPVRVSTTGAGYRVELHVYEVDAAARFHGEDLEWIERCTVTLQSGQLDARCDTLYGLGARESD